MECCDKCDKCGSKKMKAPRKQNPLKGTQGMKDKMAALRAKKTSKSKEPEGTNP